LSQNAGSFAELGRFALRINPFDVGQTSDALSIALQMSDAERARRARGLRLALQRTSPERWVSQQLEDVDPARHLAPPALGFDAPNLATTPARYVGEVGG